MDNKGALENRREKLGVVNRFGEQVENAAAKPTAQKRLIGLLEYIEQVEQMNRTPLFDVPTNFYCGFEEALRARPHLEFNVASDDVWLRAPRLKEKDPPEPSSALKPWLVLNRSPEIEPTLREHIVQPSRVKDEPNKQVNRLDFPQVDVLYQHYVKGAWSTWSEAQRPRRSTIATYNKLFLLQTVTRVGGYRYTARISLGFGMSIWRHPSGKLVRYPLITQLVEIGLYFLAGPPTSPCQRARSRTRPLRLSPLCFSLPFVKDPAPLKS